MPDPISRPAIPISPQPTPPCDPETTECVDPRTGGPASASSTGRPLVCEGTGRPGAAEVQYRRARDVFERIERETEPTCNADRIRRLLQRAPAQNVCMPPAQGIGTRPGTTVAQFERSQSSERTWYLVGSLAQLAGNVVLGEGVGHGVHGVAEAIPSVTPVAPGVGVVAHVVTAAQAARESWHWQREFIHFSEQQQQAMSALVRDWQRYEQTQDASARAQILAQGASVEAGARLVRDNLLDDPIVQRRIAQDPYLSVGVELELSQRRAAAAGAAR